MSYRRLINRAVATVAVLTGVQVAARAEEAKPWKVDAGIYLLSVSEVDLRQGTCVADFWVWFRWKDREHDPLEGVEVLNGSVEERSGKQHKDLGGGLQYATQRLKVKTRQAWDVARFPLDTQRVVISLEDAQKETHEVVFEPDMTNSRASPSLTIPGWDVCSWGIKASEVTYETNYGDTTAPTGILSSYSRLSATLELSRPGMGLFFKLFAGLFAAVGIALLALMIRPTHLDPRFGLPVGAMFAAIASQYVISSVLPDSTEFTLADQLHVLSMVIIFLVLSESVISLSLCDRGLSHVSARCDRLCLVVLAMGFVASVFGLIMKP